jgi:hypothetical protein
MTPVAGERSHGARRPRRPVFVALGAVLLLGLVALAARSHAPTGGNGTTHSVPGDLILEYVLLMAVAVGLVVMPLLAMAFWTNRRQQALTRRQTNWAKKVLAIALVIVLIFALRWVWELIQDARNSSGGGRRFRVPSVPVPTDGSDARLGQKDFDWVPVVVVGVIVLVGGIVAFFAIRSHERTRRREESIAEQLSNVLDDTLDDLRAEPDPRRAVIAAYARMEQALAWFGLPRRVFEAPLEYLTRVLVELRASAESVSRLTGLFERAKFSTHDIGPGLKDEAIEALVAVRDELRAYS